MEHRHPARTCRCRCPAHISGSWCCLVRRKSILEALIDKLWLLLAESKYQESREYSWLIHYSRRPSLGYISNKHCFQPTANRNLRDRSSTCQLLAWTYTLRDRGYSPTRSLHQFADIQHCRHSSTIRARKNCCSVDTVCICWLLGRNKLTEGTIFHRL